MQYTRSNSEGQESRSSTETGDILERIIASKRAEVGRLVDRGRELRTAAAHAPPIRSFATAIRRADEVALLAEIKRRSPSAGPIRPDLDAAEIARAYAEGGAAAISVLTDRDYFGGSLNALREARNACDLPILRKDFIVDALQIWEARAAGADAILLIVRALGDDDLVHLLDVAREASLDVLVEVHDRGEMRRALGAGATIIGVNNRDLRTFTTDVNLTFELAAGVPPEVTLLAESGIRTPDEVARLGRAGIDAVLVGESLMRQDDVAAAARALTGHRKSHRSR